MSSWRAPKQRFPDEPNDISSISSTSSSSHLTLAKGKKWQLRCNWCNRQFMTIQARRRHLSSAKHLSMKDKFITQPSSSQQSSCWDPPSSDQMISIQVVKEMIQKRKKQEAKEPPRGFRKVQSNPSEEEQSRLMQLRFQSYKEQVHKMLGKAQQK